MNVPQFFPWQAETAQLWLDHRDCHAHAWLFHGMPGIGKRNFAIAAAASLLCEWPTRGLACGHCPACAWFVSGSHPDYRLLRPLDVATKEGACARSEAAELTEPAGGLEKNLSSKNIHVDQIRMLESWFNTSTHRGGWRVALIDPAQTLSIISSNALLKMVEEPPPKTIFLLVADAPDRLVPTLASRCRRLLLPVPPRVVSLQWLRDQSVEPAVEWLAAAGGAPLLALRRSQNGESACPAWLNLLIRSLACGKLPNIELSVDTLEIVCPTQWIDALQRLFTDLMLAAVTAPVHYFPALSEPIAQIAQRAHTACLAETASWLTRQRACANRSLGAKIFIHAVLQRVAQSCQISSTVSA